MATTNPSELGGAFGMHLPPIRSVNVDQSGYWLAAGWNDFKRAPGISIAYGLFFAALGYLLAFLLIYAEMGSLLLPAAAGFAMLAPVLAVGLFEVSRRLETDQPVSLAGALSAITHNASQIANLGLVLLMLYLAWVEMAIMIFALFFSGPLPSMENFLPVLSSAPQAIPFLLVGGIAGGILAAIAFAVSVVSLPMLLDRNASTATAIVTSLIAAKQNWRVMVGWAFMLALLAFSGLALFFVGLAVTLPLAAYASWHAYRGMVESE